MILWKFIVGLEGGLNLRGYVPRGADGTVAGHSGVSIADGVDLGQRNVSDLAKLKLDPALDRLLSPYAGVTGDAAAAFLARIPLVLTADQARQLSDAVHAANLPVLAHDYDAAIAAGAVVFDQLPDEPATVICSVAHQYGSLAKACPRFWRAAVAQDWGAVIAELENFGDAYKTRRYNEADFLRGMMLA
jgi:hypothetical protein